MTKIKISMLLLTLILIFSACGTDNDKDSVKDSANKRVDMYEAHFIYATNWVDQMFAEIGFTDSTDKMRARYTDAMEYFNMTFEVVYTDDNSSIIANKIFSGMDVPDFVDIHANQAYALYKNSMLIPIEEISTIDLNDEKWGPTAFLQYGNFNGKTYGTYQYAWEFIPEYAGILLWNGLLEKQLGMPNPYELQEKGEWNWANFRKMLEDVTVPSGEDKLMGMSIDQTKAAFHLMETAVFSNGGSVVKDDNGRKVFALTSPESYEAMDFIAKLKKDKLVEIDTTQEVKMFTSSQSMFMFCEVWRGTLRAESAKYLPSYTMDDYGFISFPTGPKAPSDKTVSAFVHVNRHMNWVLNGSDNEPDDVGRVMDYIFEPLDNTGGWKKMAKEQIFLYNQGYDNFVYMLENIKYNYSAELLSQESSFEAAVLTVFNGTRTPSAAMEAIATAINTSLDNEINDYIEE